MNNIPALVQIMAGRHPGYKPLSETMMVSSPMHICVTRPQWVNIMAFILCYYLHMNRTYFMISLLLWCTFCASNVPFKCIYSPKVYNQFTECIYSYKIHGFLGLMRYMFRWHWWNLPHWTSLMYWMCLLAWILSAPVNTWHCPTVHQCVCHQCWICSSVYATRWTFDCLTVGYFELQVSL